MKARFNGILILCYVIFSINPFLINAQQQATDSKQLTQVKEVKKEATNSKKEKISTEKRKRVKGYYKYDQPDQFAEFFTKIKTSENVNAPSYSANYLIEEHQKAIAASRLLKTKALDWKERGPGNVSGRTRGIVVDISDATTRTWFAGSVAGGIWKTTNAGTTWENKTNNLPNLATSVIVQSKSNPDILYCGTGEGFFNTDAIKGSGIFKSTDHGNSWSQLASTANYTFYNVNRMIVDPANPNIVLAATNAGPSIGGTYEPAGIHRSTDGGLTWQRVYSSTNLRVQDLKANPVNFNIQYAAVNNTGVIKSTDGGLSWAITGPGIVTIGRIEIAVSPKNPEYIFANVESGTTTAKASGLFFSADAGASWNEVKASDGKTNDWLGGQGWYDNAIACHPYNEKIVYMGGIGIWKAELLGTTAPVLATFTPITFNYTYTTKPYVHVDQHNITLVPKNEATNSFWFISGNDGGVAYSTNAGASWTGNAANTSIGNGGYNTTQFYGVDKKPGASEYAGGMQDNGTWQSPSGQEATLTSLYKEQIGGDGFDVAWHHKNPNKIIGGSQYNGFLRTTDGGASWSGARNGMVDNGSGKGPFISKIGESNIDPDVIYTTGISGIWRSENFGATWALSEITSKDWTHNSSSIPVSISLADPQIVWSGHSYSASTSKLFLSTDGGLSFTSVKAAAGYTLGTFTGLDTHPTDTKTAYLTYSFRGLPKILRTTDFGVSWTDITGFGNNKTSSTGFPDVGVYCVAVMPYNTNIIWAGTEIGLFESVDNGATWHYSNSGLPAVAIWDMKVVDDQVVLATHGRGIFSVTLDELKNYKWPTVTIAPIINSASQSPDGSLLVSVNLRSAYDKSEVYLNDQKTTEIGITPIGNQTFKFATTSSGTATIQIISYKDGKIYKTAKNSVFINTLKDTKVTYNNDFNTTTTDFYGNGFQIKSDDTFISAAIHSPHSYAKQTDYYYTLLVPIKVAQQNAFFEYDDIALVEPGEAGVPFGNSDFYDYVAVEASKDGTEWIPIEDGYDCRYRADWLAAYNSKTFPTPSMFAHHKVNLLNKFKSGDVVLIRFHLYSDPESVGWGWIIDNLQIQPNGVGVNDKEEIPTEYALEQNFPNPFNPETVIKYSIPKASMVSLKIYDVLGREVATLINQNQNAGRYTYNFSAANYKLASGVYMYRLEAGSFVDTKKLILVK